MKSLVIMKKATEFEYTLVATFCREQHEQGGTTYDVRISEDWGDGHRTLRKFKDFRNNKAVADSWYRDLKRDGYVVKDAYSFEPTQMDMR